MGRYRRTRTATVQGSGAAAGSILRGIAPNNQGLRLRVLEEQTREKDGPIIGSFTILDSGDNMHSGLLDALLTQVTNAEEVLRIIRGERPGCVSVVNTNVLALEQST